MAPTSPHARLPLLAAAAAMVPPRRQPQRAAARSLPCPRGEASPDSAVGAWWASPQGLTTGRPRAALVLPHSPATQPVVFNRCLFSSCLSAGIVHLGLQIFPRSLRWAPRRHRSATGHWAHPAPPDGDRLQGHPYRSRNPCSPRQRQPSALLDGQPLCRRPPIWGRTALAIERCPTHLFSGQRSSRCSSCNEPRRARHRGVILRHLRIITAAAPAAAAAACPPSRSGWQRRCPHCRPPAAGQAVATTLSGLLASPSSAVFRRSSARAANRRREARQPWRLGVGLASRRLLDSFRGWGACFPWQPATGMLTAAPSWVVQAKTREALHLRLQWPMWPRWTQALFARCASRTSTAMQSWAFESCPAVTSSTGLALTSGCVSGARVLFAAAKCLGAAA